MKVHSQILSPSVARGITALCAVAFTISVHTAQAGTNVWTSNGPGGGSVTTLAIDPSTPPTLYAGYADTYGGGVFKSTDGTTSWQAVHAGLPDDGVTAVAIDPSTPHTLYAGTRGSGVYRSTEPGPALAYFRLHKSRCALATAAVRVP